MTLVARGADLNTVAEQEPLRNHDAVKLIVWTIVGYAWRIAGSLLQIIFVLYVFSRIENRFDTIVIAISGLIYVSILSIDLYFIEKLIESEQEDRAIESKKKQPHAMSSAAILGFGFFVVGLVCLYHLVNAL
jgi:high-affinity Fe2+/Pb2+ permease